MKTLENARLARLKILSRDGRVGSIPAPGTILAGARLVPRAMLRRAVFGASRLDLAGTIPAPAITYTDFPCFVDRPTRVYR
jgi:hypothetical protein